MASLQSNSFPQRIECLQRRDRAILTLATTILFLSIDAAKSFTQQQGDSLHGEFKCFSNFADRSTCFEKNYLFNDDRIRRSCRSLSSSSLSMFWANPEIFTVESLPSSLRSFSGWYSEEDPTPNSVVYNDWSGADTYYGSFADEWSMISDSDFNTNTSPTQKKGLKKPFKRVRALAYRLARCLPRGLQRYREQ